MGRNRVENRREVSIACALTREEYNKMHTIAGAKDSTCSALVRKLVLQYIEKNKRYIPKAETTTVTGIMTSPQSEPQEVTVTLDASGMRIEPLHPTADVAPLDHEDALLAELIESAPETVPDVTVTHKLPKTQQ